MLTGVGRDALRTNILIKLYMLDVDIAHLISFNEELAHRLSNEPAEILPIVCRRGAPLSLIFLTFPHSSSRQYETVDGACS